MSAPTPTTSLITTGKSFVATWNAVWANTDVLTDGIVVDLSGLPYTNRMRIFKIHIAATAGISATLEFDASSDVQIYRHPVGVVGNIVLDYADIDGLQPDTGSEDIVVTSSSQASGDEISIVVIGTCA